jgi:hypothetical protein
VERNTTTADRRLFPASVGPVVIVLAFLALSLWSWRKWPDILVDFGRELYVPWQLSTGKVLYRDIAYFNGPFSPYLNALWFHLFGVSITTIAVCNLAILALSTVMIYRLFHDACDRLTATACCGTFLCVFGFAQLADIGNYNFVSPYSHELTHGLALSIGMIFCLALYFKRCRPPRVFLAGFLLGLVFLTKMEVFLAAFAAAGLGLVTLCLIEPESRRQTVFAAFWGIAGWGLAIGMGIGFLASQMPFGVAVHGIAGAWESVARTDVTRNLFYMRSMGLDQPIARLLILIRASAAVLFLILATAAADAALKLPARTKVVAMTASVGFLVVSTFLKRSTNPWMENGWLPVPWLLVGGVLPFATLALPAALALARRITKQDHRLLPLVIWSVFAFVLMGKIILSPRLFHYGFALAMPAALALVACVLHFLPHALQRIHGGGDVFRRFALAMLIADAIFLLKISNGYYSSKNLAVGSGGDAILTLPSKADPRGAAVAEVLARIDAVIPSQASFVVLPEGVMLNYLSRRINPTPYVTFMPPELSIFGERNILMAMQQHPPDFVLLVPKDTSEYGVAPFGVDPNYGMEIMEWVKQEYAAIDSLPSRITILKRRAP